MYTLLAFIVMSLSHKELHAGEMMNDRYFYQVHFSMFAVLGLSLSALAVANAQSISTGGSGLGTGGWVLGIVLGTLFCSIALAVMSCAARSAYMKNKKINFLRARGQKSLARTANKNHYTTTSRSSKGGTRTTHHYVCDVSWEATDGSGNRHLMQRNDFHCDYNFWLYLPEETTMVYLQEDPRVFMLEDSVEKGFNWAGAGCIGVFLLIWGAGFGAGGIIASYTLSGSGFAPLLVLAISGALVGLCHLNPCCQCSVISMDDPSARMELQSGASNPQNPTSSPIDDDDSPPAYTP